MTGTICGCLLFEASADGVKLAKSDGLIASLDGVVSDGCPSDVGDDEGAKLLPVRLLASPTFGLCVDGGDEGPKLGKSD